MSRIVIEDLIDLFLNQKIDKDSLLKILNIYKISYTEFNEVVIEKIKARKKSPVLKISSLLDDRFLKDLKKQAESSPSITKYDFDPLYKSNKFITCKMVKRLLRVEELGIKIEQYFKLMDIDKKPDKETIDCLYKGIEIYIKKLMDKCDILDIESIKKNLGKDTNILNIY